jgi:acetylornithine/N-succinyldiaminopimelate aminotransferase
VRALGTDLSERLNELDGVAEVRGRGLMVGVTLADALDAANVAARALNAGLVLNVPGPDMLRLLPPLVIGEADVDEALSVLQDSIAEPRSAAEPGARSGG